jgi:hypothetical protein
MPSTLIFKLGRLNLKLRLLRFLILLPGVCIAIRADPVGAPIEIIANVQAVEKQPDPMCSGVAVWLKIQSPVPLKGIEFVLDTGIADSATIVARFPQGSSFVFLVPEPLTAGMWKVKRYADNMSRPGVKFIATDLAAVPFIELAKLSTAPRQLAMPK